MRSNKRLSLALALVLLLILALPPVALAQGGETDRFNLFGDVVVNANETVASATSIFGSVRTDGVVSGDVTSIFGSVLVNNVVGGDVAAIFGSAEIAGPSVGGDVAAVFGSIDLRNNVVVAGNVTAVFGGISKTPGVQVRGREVGNAGMAFRPPEVGGPIFTPGRAARNAGFNLVGSVIVAMVFAAIAMLVMVLFPRRVQVTRDTLMTSPWGSLGVGCLANILAIPLSLLLLVLIPCLGFFLTWLVVFLGTLLGLVAMGWWVGNRTLELTPQQESPLMTVLVGSIILSLLLAIMGWVPFINLFSGIVTAIVFSMALGAVLLSRFGGNVPGPLGPAGAGRYPPAPLQPGPPSYPAQPAPPTYPAAPAAPPPAAPAEPPPSVHSLDDTPPAPPAAEDDTTRTQGTA